MFALDLREIHPPLLENTTLPHHPGPTATAFRPNPTLLCKTALSIESFQAGTDLILKTHHHRSGPFPGICGRQLQRGMTLSRVRASENPADQGANHASQTVIWKPKQTTPAMDKVP